MKRKTGILLTGCALALALTAGSVQAKTLGYDLGNGSTAYYFSGGGAKIKTQTEETVNIAGEAGQTAEQAFTDAADGALLTEEERGKRQAWYRASMQEAIASVEKYGVSYDIQNDRLLYNGQTVRWLIDEQIDGNCEAIHMPEGEIDLYTVRTKDYTLTGVRTATQEEYDERTRQDELEARRPSGTEQTASEEGGNALYDGVTVYSEPEGGVLYTWVEEGDTVHVQLNENAEKEESAVKIEDAEKTESAVQIEDAEKAESESALQTVAEETIEMVCEGSEGAWADTEAEKKKAAEYAKEGITRSQSGGWLWNGKAIYFLLDEDGGLSVNNTSETEKDKIYILVKRSEDGSIKEVKQMTSEEVLQAKARMDE